MHIGRLNHVAIAVKDIAKAAGVYRDTLGAEISPAVAQPDHGLLSGRKLRYRIAQVLHGLTSDHSLLGPRSRRRSPA